MSDFESAISIVLDHEKGYVNDPDDSGGATNLGISLRWLKSIGELDEHGHLIGDIDHDGDVDINDIRNLNVEDAKELYKKYWWDKYKYENILSQKIATKVFDLVVNMGSIQAHKNLQRAIRAVTGKILIDDGIIGNVSLQAINACNDSMLLTAFRSETAGFYRVLNKPKYINGWLNRAYF